MRATNYVRLSVVVIAIVLCSTPLCAGGADNQIWSMGYRFELLTADGSPANDMMGSGAYAHYHIGSNYRVEWALEYLEYDFESPQRYLGFPRNAVEDTDSRTRCTLISLRVERAWFDKQNSIRPIAFAGLGMGYAVVDDIHGSVGGQSFDINAEGGIETVPAVGVGLRYQKRRFMVDTGIKMERHFTEWNLEDRLTGIRGEVGDYTAWGGWIGLSVYL